MAEHGHRTRQSVALIAGRYELVRELGRSGDVLHWEAFDSALHRRVLLEFLPQELVDDPAAVERFWQSARSSARASTATGERVLDAGTDVETGRIFVVREWSESMGETVPIAVPRHNETRKSTPAFDARRALLIGLLLAVGVGVWAINTGVHGWLNWVNEPLIQMSPSFVLDQPTAEAAQATQQPGPQPTAVVVAPTKAIATVAPAIVPTPARTASPASSGVPRRIVNTDGQGVALRASPGGDRLPGKGYDEGVTVTAFEQSGEWTHIRGSDGREGWVLSVTLAP
jgi:hypothetical protein